MGIKNAIEAFKENGIDDNYNGIYGIRIDSGDLAYLSKKCRKELDNAGFKKAKIVLTSSLNEELIRSLKEQEACVDSFGVGDAIATSKSNPCFGGVYKIVQINGEPVIKLSEDVFKISNPGFKEIYRIYDKCGAAYADLITLVEKDEDKNSIMENSDLTIIDERYDFKRSLLKSGEYTAKKITIQYMKDGVLTESYKTLLDVKGSRDYYIANLNNMSEERKRLVNPHKYKIDLSKDLLELKYSLIKKIKSQI